MKKTMILPALLLVGNLCTTPIYALENKVDTDYLNETEQGQAVQESMDDLMTSSKNDRENAESTSRVQEMFKDTQSQFAGMKDNYSSLANNYGNIKTIDSSAVYSQYLDSLNTSKDKIGFTDKMNAIQNFDMSMKDSGMKDAFHALKDKVGKDLKDDGLNVGALSDKFSMGLSMSGKEQIIAMNKVNQGARQYKDVLAKYQASLKQSEQNTGNNQNVSDTGAYSGNEMKELSKQVGMNFGKAKQENSKSSIFQSGDKTKGFLSTTDILNNIQKQIK